MGGQRGRAGEMRVWLGWMQSEWEGVGNCSREAEALKVEETQGLQEPELALLGYPNFLGGEVHYNYHHYPGPRWALGVK